MSLVSSDSCALVSQEATQEWPASGTESRTERDQERASDRERERKRKKQSEREGKRERERKSEKQSERERAHLGDGVWDGRSERGRVGESGAGGCIRRVRWWAYQSTRLCSAGFEKERESTRALSPSRVNSFPEVWSVWQER